MPPALTTNFNPLKSPDICPKVVLIYSIIFSGSIILPSPDNPDASSPVSGPKTKNPLFFNLEIFSIVIGFLYIYPSIAGHINTGLLLAKTVAVTGLSAKPLANFAIVLAVAGAITMKSHLSATET